MDDYREVDEPEPSAPGQYRHPVLRTRGAVVCARIISIIVKRCPAVFGGLTGRQVSLLERDISRLLDEAFRIERGQP